MITRGTQEHPTCYRALRVLPHQTVNVLNNFLFFFPFRVKRRQILTRHPHLHGWGGGHWDGKKWAIMMYSPCHTWKHLNMSQGGGQIRESIGLSLTVGIWVLSMQLLKAVLSDFLRCARCLVTAPSLILSLTLGLGGKYELDLEKKKKQLLPE